MVTTILIHAFTVITRTDLCIVPAAMKPTEHVIRWREDISVPMRSLTSGVNTLLTTRLIRRFRPDYRAIVKSLS